MRNTAASIQTAIDRDEMTEEMDQGTTAIMIETIPETDEEMTVITETKNLNTTANWYAKSVATQDIPQKIVTNAPKELQPTEMNLTTSRISEKTTTERTGISD